jgi:hypothetical protein
VCTDEDGNDENPDDCMTETLLNAEFKLKPKFVPPFDDCAGNADDANAELAKADILTAKDVSTPQSPNCRMFFL